MTFVRNISLGDNMSGQIVKDISLKAGENIQISHNLKVVPKYWIMLRRRGNSVIADGPTRWSDKSIYLSNVGAEDDTITILIMRD